LVVGCEKTACWKSLSVTEDQQNEKHLKQLLELKPWTQKEWRQAENCYKDLLVKEIEPFGMDEEQIAQTLQLLLGDGNGPHQTVFDEVKRTLTTEDIADWAVLCPDGTPLNAVAVSDNERF
jgi:hypothetical protein